MKNAGARRMLVGILVLCLGLTTVVTDVPAQISTGAPEAVYGASYPKLKSITYEPTGDQRKDIVGFAKTQVGYAESGNNNTYFGNWFGLNYNPWCAMFVCWSASKAGVATSVIPRQANADREWAKKKGIYYKSKQWGGSYTPKAGDIIYFSWSVRDYADHVGLVSGTGTENGTKYVYTIEGNKHDKVVQGSYKLSNKYILGYASPKYTTTVPENGYLLKYRESVSGKNQSTAIGIFEDNLVMAGKIFTQEKYTYSKWQIYRLDSAGNPLYLCRDTVNGREEQWCSAGTIPAGYRMETVKTGGSLAILTQVEGTIYATPVWTKKTYKITYDANGGLNPPPVQKKTIDKKIKLAAKKPNRTGYTFKGWATSKNAKKVTYKPGATYKKNKKLTLYAVWKPLKKPFKVSVIKDDGLNVRSGPGTKYKVVKLVKKGKKLNIVQVKGKWGRIKGKKNTWVMLKYTKKIK